MGNPKEKSTQGALEEFQQAVASLFDVWESHVDTNDDQPQVPVFLDLLAGPNYPLSQAFQWAGWKVVQPIDYQIDNDFDITNPSVQHAVSRILPQCHLVSAAMDCSTKSRIREIRLPGAQGRDLHRVVQDNKASDFQLAVQHVMHEKGRGAIRENPARSLHWEDPNEKWVCENGDWHDYHYDSCCFNAVRRKAQKLRHNMIELCALPSLQCAHWHDPAEWRPYTDQAGVRVYPSREEAEYSAALVFTIAAAVSHWAVNQGFAVQKVTRLPAIECAGDRRAWLGWGPRTFREYAMGPTALQLGFRPGGQELASLPTRVHRPRRVIQTVAGQQARICGASDAAQDQHMGSGGFLLSTRFFCRVGAVVPITPAVIQLWKPCEVYIAQLELLVVFQAVITFPDEFRYASGVWYIDNIASLMALIKGRSDNLDLDHLAQMIHLLLYHLHCSLWFEWIQSKSNWSDGISRDGFKDRFIQNYAFQCHNSSVSSSLWQLPIFLLSLVFSFL